MTTAPLSQNSVFSMLSNCVKQRMFIESAACLQGFVLGMFAQGFKSSDRKMLNHTVEILNDGESIPGTAVAAFTALLIEEERNIDKKSVNFFIPTPADRAYREQDADLSRRRLQALSDLVYGMSLGYTLTPEGALSKYALSYEQRDDLMMLSNLSNLDVDSGVDEKDLKEVQDYLKKLLYGARARALKKLKEKSGSEERPGGRDASSDAASDPAAAEGDA